MQLLPTEILDWVNLKDLNLDNYSNNGLIGRFLEFDLDYPDEFHGLHNIIILSFSSKKIKVAEERMSEYQLKVMENNVFLGKNKYLIPNLGNKKITNFNIKT